jgi:methyl-accepting chemotaxis protein
MSRILDSQLLPADHIHSDSQRYTKALDVFAKIKKEYASKAKDLKAEVAEYRSHRHAAHQFQKELRERNEVMESIEEEMDSIRREIAQTQDEKKRIDAIIRDVDEIATETQELRQKLVGTE